MEKFETLIAAVVFQFSGQYAYNRQQLCEFTTKDVDSEFTLRIGETFYHNGDKYRIENIHFAMEGKYYSQQKTLEVFTKYDNNPVNCKVYVSIEKI
ncbi:hypothetical protein [Flavobacterium pectinovorum]|jgi:hypothetical protein|uniref:DUF3127 domain-containing protein n=1 Tax=Flavobacterium pectinovorum TaxID=29533 RepID=A0AB36NY10_9FLAO|nr:hypothetical protein [Flavobacterium pectinovorum]OXB02340.1 hypothetical protein B0A72_16935 [Flavobacterium pectinovorum]SHM38634.1 hypothetical protein SAMN05444387_2365 [Flavobacterium pectinovorum]